MDPYANPRIQTALPLAELRARGYCRVSRRYRHASRIDRADWLVVLQLMAQMSPVSHGLRTLASHYRRCYSNDVVQVSEDVLRLLPSSEDDDAPWDYLPADGDDSDAPYEYGKRFRTFTPPEDR